MGLDRLAPIGLATLLVFGGCAPKSTQIEGSFSPIVCPKPESSNGFKRSIIQLGDKNVMDFYTYPNGAIVNRAPQVDLAVFAEPLDRINTSPIFGINLTPDQSNYTFFFPQSFANPKDYQAALDYVQNQYIYVAAEMAKQQGKTSGSLRFSVISIGDALAKVIQSYPNNGSLDNDFYRRALSINLSYAYSDLASRNITDPFTTPSSIATPDANTRTQITGCPLPINVVKIDPRYAANFTGIIK